MKKFLSLLAAVPVLLASGGVVPDGGMGSYDNGQRDPIAFSHYVLQWRYEMSFDFDQRDYITMAVARFDYDIRPLRLIFHTTDYHIYFDHVLEPATEACSIPGASGCVMGWTTCQTWGENVGDNYRICNLFRIKMYPNNIAARAAAKGYTTEEQIGEMWQRILYHEIAHAVGLRADVVGPVAGYRLSPCHKALLNTYRVDPLGDSWVFAPTPPECLPPVVDPLPIFP